MKGILESYHAELSAVDAIRVTTLSSKHQITLPAALVRELNIKPGDKLTVSLENGRIWLRPRPRSLLDLGGSMPGYYGKTKEEIDAYLAEVRGDWGTPLED